MDTDETQIEEMLEFESEEEKPFLYKETTEKIIGAAFEVHRQLGYGFLERVYQRSIQVELLRDGISAEIEKRIQVRYKGVVVGDYDADLIVEEVIAVELKIAPQYDKRDEAGIAQPAQSHWLEGWSADQRRPA